MKKEKDMDKTNPIGGQIAVNSRKPEIEGFMRSLSVPEDEVPRCGSSFFSFAVKLNDFRGGFPEDIKTGPHGYTDHVIWETACATHKATTIFTWIGGSQVRPVGPSYPYATAKLYAGGQEIMDFPLGVGSSYEAGSEGFRIENNGFILSFEPRRFLSLVEASHRVWTPHGVSGFYRLEVPGGYVEAGRSLKITVKLNPVQSGREVYYYTSPRTDALRVDLDILRDEVTRLQKDLVQLKYSHEMLYMKAYPELFPQLLQGKRIIACQDETKHLHPVNITALSDGELIMTFREATDHLATDGRMVMIRSKDQGETWSRRQQMFDLGGCDHRASPVFELPDGVLATTDYRAGGLYNEKGLFGNTSYDKPTLWAAWSRDRGVTWEFADSPITVPGGKKYAEVERPMIMLPSGRLILAANYYEDVPGEKIDTRQGYRIAVLCSDDLARTWKLLAKVPGRPYMVGECALLRTKSGKIVMMSRSAIGNGVDWMQKGPLYQSDSLDEGMTWSEFRPTEMSSMSSPAHLLQLNDGRILCTHASRSYPGSIYVTVSRDEAKTWDTDDTRILTNDLQNFDSCYPTTAQLEDGTLLTAWYANLFGKFYITVFKYRADQI